MHSSTPFRLSGCLLLVTAFLACDRVGEDLAPPTGNSASETAEFYTFPTEPVAIDLKSFADLKTATTFTLTRRPQSGRASFSTDGLLVYTPNADFTAGQDVFTLQTTESGSTDKTFRVNVSTDSNQIPCNAGPLPDNVRTPTNTPVTISVLENDLFCSASVDLQSLAVQRSAANGTLAVTNGKVVYTPKRDYVGYDEFLYKVTATTRQTRSYVATVRVIVGDIYQNCIVKLNDDQVSLRPRFVSDTLLIAPLLNDQVCQPAGSVSLSIAKNPANGTIYVLRNQYIVYRPNEGFTGNDELTYQRCDGTCQQARVSITVRGPEAGCRLAASNDSFTYSLSRPPADFKAGTALLAILGNDQLCAPIKTVRITDNPAGLKLSVSNEGVISYTVDAAPNVGAMTFGYELTDTQNNKATATVTVNITQ